MNRDPTDQERRRKEQLLTFSPREWLWMVLLVVILVVIMWAR